MKKIFKGFVVMSMLTILFQTSAYSANEQFRSVTSGNWNANPTWEMSTNSGSTWFAATSTPTDTSGNITIRSPHTVTVTAGSTANQLTIDSNAVLAINNSVILTITAGSGNDVSISPGGTLNGPGTVRTQGTIELGIPPGSAFNAALNINTGVTVAYDPNGGPLFGNVTIDAGATLNGGNGSGRKLFIYGNVTNNGTLTASSTGGILRIKGPSLVNNGSIPVAGSLYFDTTTSLSGSGTFTPANTYIAGNVSLSGNITYSPTSQITIETGGILNPNGNIFTLTSGTMSLAAGATVSASGIVRTQGTITLLPDIASAFNAALNINTGVTVAYDANGGPLFGNVSIDAGATLNGGNVSGRKLFIYGNVTNNGTLTASSTGGVLRIKGSSLINNGSIPVAGSLYFDNTTSISGSGSFTAASTYIAGNVSLSGNITYSPTSQIIIETGGILNPNGNIFTLTSGTMSLAAGATVSASGTVRTQGTITLLLDIASAFNAALNVNTGVSVAYDPSGGPLFGNVTIDAGATLNGGNVSGRKLFIYGNVINNGTLTASSTGGIIRIKGPSLVNNGIINQAGSFFFDTTTSLSGTGSFTSQAVFSVNSNVTLNSSHQMSSLNINSGAVFNISNRLLKLTATGPLTVSGTFNTTGSTIEYNGSALQSISTTGIIYFNLRINNSGGTILSNNVAVMDTLSVISGDLDLSGKIITLSSTGYLTETPGNTLTGATGYITTTRSLNAPSSLNVGGLGAVLTASSNLGNTEIRRGHGVQTGGSINRYFDITPTNNSGLTATLKFKYDDSELNLRPESTLKLLKSTDGGTSFTIVGGTVNTALNEITLSGITSFSRWTADSSGVSAVISMAIEGFYNSAINRLRMQDTVRIYLRNIFSPYSIVDSAKTILDSVTLKAACVFANATNGIYYIQTKHRNSLETWSRSGGETYSTTSTLNYDFTTDSTKAYGSNMKKVALKWTMFSGDPNQSGNVNLADIVDVFNNASLFSNGYVPTDINGDRTVNLTDIVFTFNNSALFATKVTP